jgi:hypothetical protein
LQQLSKILFMKALLMGTAILVSLYGYSQQTTGNRSNTRSGNQTTTSKTVSKQTGQPSNQSVSASQRASTTPSATQRQATNSSNTSSASSAKSPFVGGIQAAPNADKALNKSANSSRTTRSSNNNTNSVGVNVAGGNDTTFNVNTVNQGGVTTNSGAVDRSGQSQFGQTNWGRNNRNTVGESQWTVPPPITSSFNKQYPGANSVEWQRNNADTTQFTARYNFGGTWVTTTYNNGGEKLETRTEIPLVQAPRPVSVYLAKQPSNFTITSIYRLQLHGKPQVYEVKTSAGKTIYINDDGMETAL